MSKKTMVHVGNNKAKALVMIAKMSGAILADYGESLLVQAEDAELEALKAEGYRIREIPDVTSIRIGGFELDTTDSGIRSISATESSFAMPSGRSHYLLQLAGPMHPDWKRQLERLGVRFWQAIDENAYLVEAESKKLNGLQALDFVESVLAHQPSMKVNPTLLTEEVQKAIKTPSGMRSIETATPSKGRSKAPTNGLNLEIKKSVPVDEKSVGNLELVLFDARDQIAVVDAARAAGANVIKAAGEVIIVYAPLKLVPKLAAIAQVKEVNPYSPLRLHNNVADGLIKADVVRNNHDLDGSGQIVAIADTGLDTGVNDATMLDDFEGRIEEIFALSRSRPGDASDLNGHGTHVAGSVLGSGANSNGRVRGMAPAARLVFQTIVSETGDFDGVPDDLGLGLFDVARDSSARIHTNSWGATVGSGAYDFRSSRADAFAFNNREFLILFSAGNEGDADANLITPPATAKNVLTIGASESLRTLPARVVFPASPEFPGGALIRDLDTQADSQNEVAAFSSVGPALNNRRKPDVVAPGSWILSARSSMAVADTGPDGLPLTRDEDGVATHEEAVGSGLPGQPILRTGDQNTPPLPAGSGAGASDNYMYLSGTSMATPITAGACALVRQYLIEQRGHTPSAALLKALIVNGAVDMGMGIPDNGQGWGRVDLSNTLFPAGTRRIQFDDTLDNAVVTGDIRTYDVFVSSVAEPLAVTLVWRDRAGATIQNRLHLRVTHVDSGVTTTSDPIGDIRNNVQKVVLDPPQLGRYQIEVEGVNVTTGIPEFLPALRQDYALVVANATGFSCNPSDIVQVIDRSGSMGFSGYMEPAKERAKQMIDILQINDKAGVVSFASAVDERFPLSLIDSEDDKNDAHGAINPISSGGSTDLRAGLAQGQITLGLGSDRPRAVVFLSDGFHTTATAPIDDAFLDGLAADGIKVYTVALGPDSDFDVLNNIAARTGTGSVYTVESAADLHKLHEIYYDIIGGLGCGGLVHLNSAQVKVESALTQVINIDNTVREAHFAMSWGTLGDDFDFTLRNPAGRTIDPGSNRAFHFSGSSHQFYRVARPASGKWKMIIKPRKLMNGQSALVTTAVLADSDIKCNVRLDPKYLYYNQLLLSLKVSYQDKPLRKGQAGAVITFPTQSTAQLLKRYADELKGIKIDSKQMKDDKGVNLDLIKLGLLAARTKATGKDIFERKQVRVKLTDDGKGEDGKAKDGIYTAFFDPKQSGVAGNFQAQLVFEAEDPKFGVHTCTKLIPVFVPQAKW